MRKVLKTGLGVTLLVALCMVAGTSTAAAVAPPSIPGDLDCASTNATSPCIKYCRIYDTTSRYPCGVGNTAIPITGTYSFTSYMSAAQQNATGIPGDPGATGTSNITIYASTNRLCATTSWSGIDSKVVAAHIHGGAAGQPENPAITINLFPSDFVNGVGASPKSGCTDIPPGMAGVIVKCPAQFSTVVHSFNHPVGAIRGQVGSGCKV